MRLEERVGERTRIARELHDTLLQSFQGLMLLFQSARNLLPERPVEAVRALDDALVRADQAIIEGRDAVHDLRSSAVVNNDLAKAMTALGEELATYDGEQKPATFRVLVEGTPQNLDPILRDEIYRIAREALRNAFHYARARRIEAEITYGELCSGCAFGMTETALTRKFLVRVAVPDTGVCQGCTSAPNASARELNVWSRPGAGTEVELTIPGSIAYRGSLDRAGFLDHARRRRLHS